MSVREAPLLKFRHLDHIHNLTEPLADEFKGKLDLSVEVTADDNGDVRCRLPWPKLRCNLWPGRVGRNCDEEGWPL